MSLLTVSGLVKNYGGLRAVNNVSIEVPAGEIVGLIGPNGAGKTTVFNLITGFVRSDEGQVEFDGESIVGLSPYQIAARGMTRTFQGTKVFRKLKVWQNMYIAQHARTTTGVLGAIFQPPSTRRERADAKQRMEDVLDLLGITGSSDQRVGDLPFMQQCMVGIGMALLTKPKLILLDEPLAGMNPQEAEVMMALIHRIREKGITILLIEHNIKAVMQVCNRVIVLDHGTKIADGVPVEVQQNKQVIEAYLGVEAG